MDIINEEDKLIDSIAQWEGYNYFPCNGNILYGPCSIKPTIMTSTAILVPVCLFIGFDSIYMKDEVSLSVPIITAVLCIITISFLITAAFADPGILKRHPLKGNIEECRRNILINQAGHLKVYRYCSSCAIIRPSRSTHCGDCNNCVERFDHHCPWIGNCAGRRNYVYFYIFVILLNILTIFMSAFCIVHIAKYVNDEVNKKNTNGANALGDCVISLFVLIYSGLSMLFTTGLLIYHTKLISNNITTKEELKRFFVNPFGNPFQRSFCINWKAVICPRLPKKSILKYFKNCKLRQIVVNTEEKKTLKEGDNISDNKKEVIVLDDKIFENGLQKAIDYKKNDNGVYNNSDDTSLVDKNNHLYQSTNNNKIRHSHIFAAEVNLDKKQNKSILSEKYSNCSENLSSIKKNIPSFHCQIDFQHYNDTRENNATEIRNITNSINNDDDDDDDDSQKSSSIKNTHYITTITKK